MSPFLSFALLIAIIIVAAKASGYLSARIGQPSVLGELLVGLILGPTVLNMLHWPVFGSEVLSESIALLAELGVLLLMLLAGLELHFSELVKSGKVAALAGTMGVVLPLLMGWGTAALFDYSTNAAIFIGLALAATSVSISAQTLMELGRLRSPVGLGLLGAAVYDDILVILFLSIFFALAGNSGSNGVGQVVLVVIRMVGFLMVASLLGLFLLPWMARKTNRLPISQGVLAFVVVACLLFAWAAEVVGGMAAITGAFLVGLFLARSPLQERIESGVSALAYGFFVPIFFVHIGLEANGRELDQNALVFTAVLIIVAVVSKLLGSGLGARLGGLNTQESLQLGIGMISRGEVGLIVAAAGLSQGLIQQETFSSVVVMVIVATLITPPLLRVSFGGRRPEAAVNRRQADVRPADREQPETHADP